MPFFIIESGNAHLMVIGYFNKLYGQLKVIKFQQNYHITYFTNEWSCNELFLRLCHSLKHANCILNVF